MKTAIVATATGLALATGSASAEETKTGANPIRRVVTLMQDMQKEIETEGEKEDDMYKKFNCYCTSNDDGLKEKAERASELIQELTSKTKAEKAEKKVVVEELSQAKKDRANAIQDMKKATAIRKKENETYVAVAGDTKTNVESINAAVKWLEGGMGATAFLQSTSLQASGVIARLTSIAQSQEGLDNSDRDSLLAFLQNKGDYVPASGQIVGILKNIKDDMSKSLDGMVEEEESAVSAFAELKKAKEKEISLATSVVEVKTKHSGELWVSIVQNENGARDATRDLEETQKFLANLDAMCKEKAAEYEERVKTRNEEIAAISEAISVLNDDDALDVFKASMGKPKVAFLQLGGKGNANTRAIQYLNNVMKVSKNAALNLLASTVKNKLVQSTSTSGKAGVDFSSVVKMIDDMVALLKKEQADDEKHKTWCEGEFDTSDDEKKATEVKIKALASSISEMNDEIANLSDKLVALQADNAALDKSVWEATEQRKAEHGEFTQKIQLNEAAIQLIGKAKNRLNKFYNPDLVKEESPAALVQIKTHSYVSLEATPEGEAPDVSFGGAKTQKSNSVMALMDMLVKDLEKEIQEAEHDEKTANKDYQELLSDAQESKAANTKSITDKTKSKADLETAKEEEKTKKIMADDKLANVQGYIADLHQSCDFIAANFEIRREARTSEQEALSNAKSVLSGASFSL